MIGLIGSLVERVQREVSTWRLRWEERERRGTYRVYNLRFGRVDDERDFYWMRNVEVCVDRARPLQIGWSLYFDNDRYSERNASRITVPWVTVYFGDLVPYAITSRVYAVMERLFGDKDPSRARSLALYSSRVVQLQFYTYKDAVTPEYIVRWSGWEPVDYGYEMPWYKHGYWVLNDVVFGALKCTTHTLSTRPVYVQMPERTYKWTGTEELRYWTRARWPGVVRTARRIDLNADGSDEYIPFPGKGENAWDLGMDGIGGCSADSWESAEEAVRRAASASREKRGWSDEDAVAYTAAKLAKHHNPADPQLADVD